MGTFKTCNFKHQGIHIHCLALKLMLYIRNIAFLRNKPRNALHYSKTSPFSNLMIIEPFNILTKITTPTSFDSAVTEFDEREFIADELHFKVKGFQKEILCSLTELG